MLKNYLKVSLRNIIKNKSFSVINISGLVIGLTSFLLIALYVKFEFSYDKYHVNADNIYRVATQLHGHHHGGFTKMVRSRGPVASFAKSELPDVLNAARFTTETDVKLAAEGKDFFEDEIFFSDPALFDIFTLPITQGSLVSFKDGFKNLVISEKTAKKYFGSKNPIGRPITYMGENVYVVSAVMKDMPENSHFKMDVIFPLDAYVQITGADFTSWRSSSVFTYLLLSDNADIADIERKLSKLNVKHYFRKKNASTLFLQPLTDIHLYSNNAGEIAENNDINNIYIFSSIALLILLIACFNYMNLAAAFSIKRSKEIGIRKTIGAAKKHIITQFLSEAFLLNFIAIVLSLFLVEMLLSYFNNLFECSLQLSSLISIELLAGFSLLLFLTSILSGSYPAFYLSSFKPVKIFRGPDIPAKGGFYLRNVFVLMQFTICIVLLISTLIIKSQLNYILSKDVGYQKEQILTVEVRGEEFDKNLAVIKEQLIKHPNILLASSSTYLPNRISDQSIINWPGRPDDIEVRCHCSSIDYDYIDLYGIEIIQGRNFSPEFTADEQGAFLINEQAVRELGWNDPLTRELKHWNGAVGKVVGVVKDFHFQPLHLEMEPLYLFFDPNNRNYKLSLKIIGDDIQETLAFVEDKVSVFAAEYPFEYNFFDDVFDRAYKNEQRMDRLITIFAVMAVVVSCLGLFGLAIFTTERRTKEIGIRKVMGASVAAIAVMLSKEFTRWVLLANLIAWPAAWYIMNSWLQNFAYKTGIGWQWFVLAGGSALLIALITVSAHTIKAALQNPVNSLRYE